MASRVTASSNAQQQIMVREGPFHDSIDELTNGPLIAHRFIEGDELR